MATINFNVQDMSGAIFKPIISKRKRPYKSAKVAPAISYDEEWVAPKAQVPMYDRWTNDCKSAKVAPFEQVPMYERWRHDCVG
jgi:hypothetical protein